MEYPDDMDRECIPLCEALNSLVGIETFESRCGHEYQRFLIAFTASLPRDIKPLLECISELGWDGAWEVSARLASGGGEVYFLLLTSWSRMFGKRAGGHCSHGTRMGSGRGW
jgi:hypothetical protein